MSKLPITHLNQGTLYYTNHCIRYPPGIRGYVVWLHLGKTNCWHCTRHGVWGCWFFLHGIWIKSHETASNHTKRTVSTVPKADKPCHCGGIFSPPLSGTCFLAGPRLCIPSNMQSYAPPPPAGSHTMESASNHAKRTVSTALLLSTVWYTGHHAAMRNIFMRAYQLQAQALTWLAATP